MYDVIIIGSGPAGLTAAIYCQRFGLSTIVIAGTKWGGQLMLTTEVENFPGFGKILGPTLMKKMREQVESFEVKIIDKAASKLSFRASSEKSQGDPSIPPLAGLGMTDYKGPFIVTAETETFEGRTIIIATGADTKWLGVPNEGKFRGHGISSCAPCDAFFFKGKPVAVVGGGDSAMEETQVIAKVASDVILIHRRDEFKAQKMMVDEVMALPNVKIIYNTQVVDVLGENTLTGVLLYTESISPKQGVSSFDELVKKFGGILLPRETRDQDDNKGQWELPRSGLFVAIGLIPNTQIFKELEVDSHGYIKRVEERDENGVINFFTKTSVPGIFTAGDVHDARYKQAVTAAGFGCMAALDVQRWLSEES